MHSAGTATSNPSGPSTVPAISTAMIENTGGKIHYAALHDDRRDDVRLDQMDRRHAEQEYIEQQGAPTGPPAPPRTNAAGTTVETSVPKNGTIAASPLNKPNVSQ